MRSASAKVSAPAGTIMNSCRSIEFCACAPPLITFSIGTGNVRAASPPIQRKSETFAFAAAAFAAASETPRIAFAPSRPLFSVPSSSSRRASTAFWSSASTPCSACAISPSTLLTACVTPLPAHAPVSPSRSSSASWTPVDAPDGTAARPNAPFPSRTSTSTVGLPRESRIWRACTPEIGLAKSELLLRLVEVAILFVERQLRPRASVARGELFGPLDSRPETIGHGPQRELGVDVQLARDVDRCEEDVAELAEHLCVRLDFRLRLSACGGYRFLQLAQLVVEIGDRTGEIRVLEPDCARAALHLARVEQRRKVLRDVVEDAFALLLLDFDPFPVLAHATGGRRIDLAEDVRVAADELLVHSLRDLREVAGAALFEQQREEVRLEEQVAELVEQLRVVAVERSLRDLIGLFDGVRHDRARRLLAIPRTLAPERLGELLQLEEGLREALRHGVVVLDVVVAVDAVSVAHGSLSGA